MKIMSYLCRAEQPVWAKAYASAPDEKQNAPSRGHPVLPNKPARALRVQHDGTVNKNSTAFSLVSIDSVRLLNNCLLFQLMKRKSV